MERDVILSCGVYDISEEQWFFKAHTVSICGYVPASSGGYVIPFHFLQQLISLVSEVL